MLRQLARLTRPVPGAGPRARALAIYSNAGGELLDAPGEGVACVDDAARGVELLASIGVETGNPEIREWAAGLLDFVLWMHCGDGIWTNFILDWSGELNRGGLTSAPGPNFWQARGLAAAVTGATVMGDQRAGAIAEAGFAFAAESVAPPDVRAVQLLALLDWMAAGRGDPSSRPLAATWAEEICSLREGATLMNSPDERGRPHLWGHIQEAAVAAAGVALRRPDLVAVAETSGLAVFEAVIEAGFDLPMVQPYDVQSGVRVMDALALATGGQPYRRLAGLARSWFQGRNSAGSPVYEPERGVVADGIDGGVVSSNSGAESNLAGALALREAAVASAHLIQL